MTLYASAKINDREFQRFSSLIYDRVGIQLPPGKKTMLEARLQKRLKTLSIDTFEDYAQYVFSPEGQQMELVHLIDVVTTNKTDFFREAAHFDYLTQKALPALMQTGKGRGSEIRLWSAGCSSGEEPYTLAMVLSDFAAAHHGFRYSILASDISTRILETAQAAVYPKERTDCIAMNYKKNYLLRSKDRSRGLVRVCPEIRSRVTFRRINFMDPDLGKIGRASCRERV